MKKILLSVIIILLLGASSGCSLGSKINSNNSAVTTDNSVIKSATGSTNEINSTHSSTDKQSTAPGNINPTATPSSLINAQGGKDISAETNSPRTITPAATIIPNSNSEVSPISVHKTVYFSTFDVNKKYFNDVNGYAELNLELLQLDGNYDGIPAINKYFVGKEKFFYDELPLDSLKEFNRKVEGKKDNWYRSADYKLEAVLGDIISMSADLNGGAGGVGWAGKEGDSFNLNTGKKLNLGDIFKVNKEEYMNFIYDFVSKQIMPKIKYNIQSGHGSGYNFEDAYSGVGYKNIRSFDPNNFYLTKNALVVFYPKYALAAGAAGPQEFSIPFESILNILAIDVKT